MKNYLENDEFWKNLINGDTDNPYKPKTDSILVDNGFVSGFVNGAVSVPIGISNFTSGVLKTDGQISSKLYELSSDFKRTKEYSFGEIKEKPLNYVTDFKNGMIYTVGSTVGSTVANMAVISATLATAEVAIPATIAGSLTPTIATAKKVVPGAKYLNTVAGKFIVSRALKGIPESMGQGGYQWYQMTHDKHGNLLTNVDMNEARNTMLKETAIMMPVSIALNASQAEIEERVLKSTAKGVFKSARRAGVDMDLDAVKKTSKEGLLTVLRKKLRNNFARITDYAVSWNRKVYQAFFKTFEGSQVAVQSVRQKPTVLAHSDSETKQVVSLLNEQNVPTKKENPKIEKFVFQSRKKQLTSQKGKGQQKEQINEIGMV